MKYTSHLTCVPQTEKLEDSQVLNNAGGYVYQISIWQQLQRFLILGTEGGSYYVSERKMTRDNAKCVLACLKEDGPRTVTALTAISETGRAPKNDPAIFALALSCAHGDPITKALAYRAIARVCRTGTHLFTFCGMINDLRGWSRGLRTGVTQYYCQPVEKLAYQLVKYRQRQGWTHRDVLRLCHAHHSTPQHAELLKWAAGKPEVNRELVPEIIRDYESVQTPNSEPDPGLIRRLPWEALPTEWLKRKDVWEALLPKMPLMALLRNLNKLAVYAGVDSNLSEHAKVVADRFTKEEILKSRLHPLKILEALRTYQAGHGHKGNLQWKAAPRIVEALDAAFYHGFQNVEPTGKSFFVGLDVSGSMTALMPGSFLSAIEAAAALLMVIVRTEDHREIIAFDNRPKTLPLTRNMSLQEAMKICYNGSFGTTNCSLPIVLAMTARLKVDCFQVITDNETYAGRVHPSQALRDYRELMGVESKLVVWGMTSTGFSIADPKDPGMLDVVGFDTSVPELIRSFLE